MEFTYGAYGDLLALLDRQGYQVATYHDWQAYPRCVILRHDIDNSPEQALALARVEREMGVHSTYLFCCAVNFIMWLPVAAWRRWGRSKLWGMSWACILMRRLILRLG